LVKDFVKPKHVLTKQVISRNQTLTFNIKPMASLTKITQNRRIARDAKLLKKRQKRLVKKFDTMNKQLDEVFGKTSVAKQVNNKSTR
jgi:hypothetical protein